jgi:hypothetical protein
MKVAERNESGQTSKLLAITDPRLRINNASELARDAKAVPRSTGASPHTSTPGDYPGKRPGVPHRRGGPGSPLL